LRSCLNGLRAQTVPPDDVIVVDNSSVIDAVEERPAPGEDWTWVRAKRNLGYGAACNLGAEMTSSDYLLFLNADLILGDQADERLRRAAENATMTAVVGPRIYGANGTIELSARTFPTMTTGFLGRSSFVTKMLAALGRPPRRVSGALGSSGRVDWISGACMLIRRDAFEEVGGFDEAFWMYWEDADICRRLRARGWATMFCTDAEAHHSTGSSGRNQCTIEAFHASAARYYERHVAHTAISARLARSILQVRMRIMLHRYARRPGN
jgi:GT2 family glycosyltransferase